MKLLIFSDLDGTFLNHETYTYGCLKSYIEEFNFEFELIFVSSKTYEEIVKIKKRLDINFPFIVENGACIFFPLDYFGNKKTNYDLTRYKNHLSLKISKFDSSTIVKTLGGLKRKYNFKFFSDLSEEEITEYTSLKKKDAKLSKLRSFSNPILWRDSSKSKKKFIDDIKIINTNLSIFEGGRFLHVLDNYDKGIALSVFLKIKKIFDSEYKVIGLGDSENDIPMLELTNFACIIKSKANSKFILKNKNFYKSNSFAPQGWKESLEFYLKEIKNF